jgi:exodeoxyribonuclease X
MIRVVDIETTGLAPPEHAIVELAAVDVTADGQLCAANETLVCPGRSIPPEASAVHHLRDADVAQAPPLAYAIRNVLTTDGMPIAFAAHNAAFERQWLDELVGGVPWICTYKVALRLWPQSPGHGNQVLRYFLNIDLGAFERVPPHRALPDAVVTAHLVRLAQQLASVDDMLTWSSEPAVLPVMTIGKYRGKPWAEVDVGFLHWMIDKPIDDADLIWNARRELERRAAAARATYVAEATKAVLAMTTVADLEQWFWDQKARRLALGIAAGSDSFNEIVRQCATRKQVLGGGLL